MARATRRLVLKRDGFRCTACGGTEQLEVHHLVPRRQGGSNDPANLVTLCAACHRRQDEASLKDGEEARDSDGEPLE